MLILLFLYAYHVRLYAYYETKLQTWLFLIGALNLYEPSFFGRVKQSIPTDEQTFPKSKRTSGAKDFSDGSLSVLPKTDPGELFEMDGKPDKQWSSTTFHCPGT